MMGVRPSELFKVEWPLAAFYLDKNLASWAQFVEGKMNEAASAVANSAVGRSTSGGPFIESARKATFAKLLGLSESIAYRQPQIVGKVKEKPKRQLVQQMSGEERKIDISKFNG